MSSARESTELVMGRQPNTVALIGVILFALALVLCGVLVVMLGQMPADETAFREAVSETTSQVRLLAVAISMGVLGVVSLLLCGIGLFLPHRQRALAVVGTIGSLLLLSGVFGVVGIGLALSPQSTPPLPEATESEAETEATTVSDPEE